MRRVRTMHRIRTLTPLFVSGVLFMLALIGIGREVWVAKVFENMPADVPSILSFLSGAFLHTELVVQVLSILALGALVWLARSFAILISSLSAQRV